MQKNIITEVFVWLIAKKKHLKNQSGLKASNNYLNCWLDMPNKTSRQSAFAFPKKPKFSYFVKIAESIINPGFLCITKH